MRQILFFIAGLINCVSTEHVEAAPPANGLVLWLDASDVDGDGNSANNPKTDGIVSIWADKSGRGNHVEQAAANRQPTYQTNGLSSRASRRLRLQKRSKSPRNTVSLECAPFESRISFPEKKTVDGDPEKGRVKWSEG